MVCSAPYLKVSLKSEQTLLVTIYKIIGAQGLTRAKNKKVYISSCFFFFGLLGLQGHPCTKSMYVTSESFGLNLTHDLFDYQGYRHNSHSKQPKPPLAVVT